jgi:hypothetical protein
MRRVLASLLVALFSFSLIAPALYASDADSKLPACCRRNGMHHCGMANPTESSGPAAHAARCADFPSASVAPVNGIAALPGISSPTHASVFSQTGILTETDARSLISYSQAGHKRGPPVS